MPDCPSILFPDFRLFSIVSYSLQKKTITMQCPNFYKENSISGCSGGVNNVVEQLVDVEASKIWISMGSVSPEQHRGVAFCTVPTLTYSRVASRCALLHTTQNLNNGSHATNRDQCTASEFTVVRINLYLGLF